MSLKTESESSGSESGVSHTRARLARTYPLLFALFPVLALAASNAGEYDGLDLMPVLVVIFVFFAGIQGILTLVLRGRASAHVAALITVGFVTLFYCVSPAIDALATISVRLSRPWFVFALTAVGISGILTWVLVRRIVLEGLTSFMAIAGVLLVAWSSSQISFAQLSASRGMPQNALTRQLVLPIGSDESVVRLRNDPARDIYLIVLDRYASSEVLLEHFGFDNRPFEDSLRRLGFTIPGNVRSNYVETILSLPSLLNFEHLTPLASAVGLEASNTSPLAYLIKNNQTVRFMQAAGYSFVFFPSPWWPPTINNRHADVQFRAWEGFDLSRELTRTDFRRAIGRRTILRVLAPSPGADPEHMMRTLDGLKDVPNRPEPTFVFAHLMTPHPPYLFDAACRIRDDRRIFDAVRVPLPVRKQAYLEQLRCLNTQLLDLVRALRAKSVIEPVILLQGDHGTFTVKEANPHASLSEAQWREHTGAFGAYYLPGGGASAFQDSVTLVNVVPNVLRYYFGADISPRPNDLYYSLPKRPYAFTRVSGGSRPEAH